MEDFIFDKVSQKGFETITGMPVATQNYRRSKHPGKLPPSYKFGRQIFYNRPDVMRWIQSCRIGGSNG